MEHIEYVSNFQGSDESARLVNNEAQVSAYTKTDHITEYAAEGTTTLLHYTKTSSDLCSLKA